MKTLRDALAATTAILLTLGSLASVAAYLDSRAADYHISVDQPSIALAALAVLGLAVAFSLIPDREDREEDV
jgi:hypothetical protein